jgi:hypothetical protein
MAISSESVDMVEKREGVTRVVVVVVVETGGSDTRVTHFG